MISDLHIFEQAKRNANITLSNILILPDTNSTAALFSYDATCKGKKKSCSRLGLNKDDDSRAV